MENRNKYFYVLPSPQPVATESYLCFGIMDAYELFKSGLPSPGF